MGTSKVGFLLLLLALGTLAGVVVKTSAERAGLPSGDARTPNAIDRGLFTAESGATPMSVTVALRLPALDEAESLLKSLHTPGDAQFHRFLTAAEFEARFAPKEADVEKAIAALAKYGLAAERTSATTLRVTGLPADMERAFSVSLHSYEVPAHGNVPGYTFHAPLTRPTAPAEISELVAAVAGLDNRPTLRPLHVQAPEALRKGRPSGSSGKATNPFGYWTVTDFANQYDVQPLYSKGLSGKGRTIGIATFASFTTSDAFAYWSALGLAVNASRVHIVNVDGGPGAPSDASGSDETTLDVEQSGGVAPGANIVVYQAPNTNQGLVDVFAAAVSANAADTLSISWGSWEWYDNFTNSPVKDPTTGKTVGITQALHELFLRAAIQGQTLFAAAGDGGAYDVNNDFDCLPSTSPSCSLTLSVDYPASDPAITAGGGTTLPGIQEYCLNAACTPPYYAINITNERVWGWDYLDGLCQALGYTPVTCGIFPVGGGGGVSVFFAEPSYQSGLAGIQRSPAGQEWIYAGKLLHVLTANYAGRNVPDVSFNADPNTGYVIYYTSSVSGFGVDTFVGGTSFVAPQLNGVTALLGEDLHSRFGLLNSPLYQLAVSGQAYKNPGAPLHAIAYGDNWYFTGRNGYSPAAGIGTLDVANFAQFLSTEF